MSRVAGPDIPYHKRAIEIDPNFASAYAVLGIEYGSLGETRQARGLALELGGKNIRVNNIAPGHTVRPNNVISGRRINTGIAFLDDGVRAGQNLAITGGVEVDRVLLEGARAVGVIDASSNQYRADLVILSAGAFGSPAIHMRSRRSG